MSKTNNERRGKNSRNGKFIRLSAQGSRFPLRVLVLFKNSANRAAVQPTQNGGVQSLQLEVDQLEQLTVHQLEPDTTTSPGFHFHFQDDLLMPCFTQPCTVPPPPDSSSRTSEFTLQP